MPNWERTVECPHSLTQVVLEHLLLEEWPDLGVFVLIGCLQGSDILCLQFHGAHIGHSVPRIELQAVAVTVHAPNILAPSNGDGYAASRHREVLWT